MSPTGTITPSCRQRSHPNVVRIPPLPGDNEDLATMQAHWIREEFQLGYTGRGSLKAEDSPPRFRQVMEDDQGSNGDSGTASQERTPRLRPVSSYAPPPAPRAVYGRLYSAKRQYHFRRAIIRSHPQRQSRPIICTVSLRRCRSSI